MRKLAMSLVALVLVVPAFAQQAPPLVDDARRGVIAYLDLSDGQIAEWDVLIAEHHDAERPLRERIGEIQSELDDLFASGAADPTAVGLLVIERHDIGTQIADIHATYVEGFELLLEDEQMDRYRLIRGAARVERVVPSFRIMELVPRG